MLTLRPITKLNLFAINFATEKHIKECIFQVQICDWNFATENSITNLGYSGLNFRSQNCQQATKSNLVYDCNQGICDKQNQSQNQSQPVFATDTTRNLLIIDKFYWRLKSIGNTDGLSISKIKQMIDVKIYWWFDISSVNVDKCSCLIAPNHYWQKNHG